MENIIKLKHQLYELELKIINLESREKKSGLRKNETGELKILREKRDKISSQIKNHS